MTKRYLTRVAAAAALARFRRLRRAGCRSYESRLRLYWTDRRSWLDLSTRSGSSWPNEHFGDKVKTTYVENVPEGADAAQVITKLASTGHKVIFTRLSGYMNPTLKVSKRFPNVTFEHTTGVQAIEKPRHLFICDL